MSHFVDTAVKLEMASATALLALLSVAITLAPSHANRQPTFDCPFAYGDFPELNSSCSSYYWTCSFWRSYFRVSLACLFQWVVLTRNLYLQPCPYGLVYNEQIKVCDWPSNVVGCTRAQSVNSQVSFQCPAANGDFPAPTPCANYFYKCSNGLPYKTVSLFLVLAKFVLYSILFSSHVLAAWFITNRPKYAIGRLM